MADPTADQTAHARTDSRLAALLDGYRVPAGHFDELCAVDGTPRAQWEALAGSGDLTREHLSRAQARVDRQIHENGVTYNVYAAADGPSRPWTLDVLPLLLGTQEWDGLASGLRQRARLLNAIAADLYGPQSLVSDGVLPAALVLRHPGFLRECHGICPPGDVFLHLVAFDLARGPDGQWRVIGTRTQSPSGAGYALENRTIVARQFPHAYRRLRVQPLTAFFETLQDTLLAGAPAHGETPHVVLLTPGPYNETYFEHVYLAKQLGFPLVEGGDLTVRHDRVFLKTVSGLRRVHAILRRTDDDYCDPLALRPDSTLGVPGLVHAWRAGTVLVANALGAGVLESPGLHAFLPAACERLLGSPLELVSLRTSWCGDETVRDHAGVVKPAFPDAAMEPVFLASVGDAAHEEWAARLRADPDAFVVEEFLPLSQTPVWHDDHFASRALMLRVFLASDGRGQYRVMPGGLARIAGSDRQIVSGQRGGGSKDTWILSDSPVEAALPLEPHFIAADGGRQADTATSSRAAEHLFWLARYAERSENSARLLRSVLARLTDPDELTGGLRDVALRVCRLAGALPRETANTDSLVVERALIEGLVDAHGRQGLAFNVAQTVRVAGAVRDRLSSDNWRLLNRLSQALPRTPESVDLDDALEMLDETIIALVAIGGLEMAHMTRNDGWRFLSIGRHLERLSFVGTTLDEVAAEATAAEPALFEWLLDLSDSLITYRSRHLHAPEWPGVLDLLLFDAHNPRSALFQIAKLDKHVKLLPGADLGELTATRADIEQLLVACHAPDSTQRELFRRSAPVDDLLVACQQTAHRLSDALTLRYFSHIYERPLPVMAI